MAITVRIPGQLRQWAEGQRQVKVESTSVGEAVRQLCASYPEVGARVLDESGEPRQFLNLYVNGEDVRFLDGTGTPLADGDELIIAPAVAGG